MEYAASVGNIQALKLMENKGIEITEQSLVAACYNHQNETLLYLILKSKHTDILNLPLIQCAIINNIEGAEILVKHGANPNAISNRGVTALMQACQHGNFEIVKILIEMGANVKTEDMAINSPITYAILGQNPSVVKILLENGVNINKPKNIILNMIWIN